MVTPWSFNNNNWVMRSNQFPAGGLNIEPTGVPTPLASLSRGVNPMGARSVSPMAPLSQQPPTPAGGEGTGSEASGHDFGGDRGPGPGARGAPGFARDAVDFGFGLLGGAIAPGFGVATALARTALDPSYNPLDPYGMFGKGSGSVSTGNNPGVLGSTGYTGAQSTAATGAGTEHGVDGGWGNIGSQGDPGARDFSADPGRDAGGADAGGGGGGGDACFAPDTLITMADGTKKRISEIRPGDQVLAFNLGGVFFPKAVARITSNGLSRRAMKINDTVVTSEHPFLRIGGVWTPARELILGDFVGVGAGGLRRIDEIKVDAGIHEVYNFEVEDLHTYIADNYWVHNSKAKGGIIKGPAPRDPRKDNLRITAQGGEFVAPRQEVQMFGPELELMRRMSLRPATQQLLRGMSNV